MATRATKALDRPGQSGMLAVLATAVATVVHRQRCVATPLGGGRLALRFRDGTVVARKPWTLTPTRMRREALDTFCWAYTPGPGDTVLDLGAGMGEEAPTFSSSWVPAAGCSAWKRTRKPTSSSSRAASSTG